ncbi:PLP-dependent aminotransferase family protein [Paenacidovorax monticola]|uniref:PLP-dependent aminotransferase family protein n=1 Tax=Paenacidovorax monticola TaxID=1926868 RepID=A0A7H0HEF6_9BURK|nr:PLP-dependent aminotransferase family protein [Paenacidovorax monticola]QNP58922.1 PLP-dependent aminotransferase family protein [Paenacidovorax monticola]
MLNRSAHLSLTEQLAERFAERIRTRLLPVGARLPSVRECARQQGVSPYTVVAAYDQLLAQGLVEARRQRGFFVRDVAQKLPATAPGRSLEAVRHLVREGAGGTPLGVPSGSRINATALIRGMFHQASAHPQPGAGVFPMDWLETSFLPAAVRKVTAADTLRENSLSYGDPMGSPELREVLSRRLQDLGVPAPPAQVMTTVGATHALDIVSRTLLKAGDPVMVEEPGWSVEFARLDALGMRVLPVPRRAEGPDLEVMARYCEAHAPKLFVSVSVFHNPTGYCLSPGSAHQVLQLAQRYNFHVVEDDTYSHIAPEHATRLTVLDGLRRSIYVSGFAKILAPAWRVGYLAAPADLMERMLDTKLLSTLTTPSLLEKALALCIEQGQLRRHAERMRMRLAQARSRSVQLALEAGCTFAAEPAGMFGWVETGVDTDVLAQRMLDEGYLIAPGALFHASRQPCTLMRINFTTTQDAAFWRVFQRVVAQSR